MLANSFVVQFRRACVLNSDAVGAVSALEVGGVVSPAPGGAQPAISPLVITRLNSITSSIEPMNGKGELCSPPIMNGVDVAGLIDPLIDDLRATSTPSTKIAIEPGCHVAAR